VRPSA